MTDVALVDPPAFGVVLLAFNTLFNLTTAAAQERCLRRAAALLAPDGCVVVEAFVPRDDVGASAATSVTPRHITADEVVLTVSQVDPVAQTITGQHVHLRESGTRLRPWHLRYATPAQVDAMAEAAGLELVQRRAGWGDEPFDDASSAHVSVYRPSNVRAVTTHPPTGDR